MGSLRGGLTASLLMPTAAWAEVCDKERPSWDGEPVNAVQEALFLFSTPAALVLILASMLAIRFRHQWGGLIVVLLWTLMVSLVSMADPTGTADLARAEGCTGSPALFIAAVAAICVAMILYTAPIKRPENQDGD